LKTKGIRRFLLFSCRTYYRKKSDFYKIILINNIERKGEMNQLDLKILLNQVINKVGIKGKVISQKTGINASDLSRFKNGQILLCERDSQKLESLLNTFKIML